MFPLSHNLLLKIVKPNFLLNAQLFKRLNSYLSSVMHCEHFVRYRVSDELEHMYVSLLRASAERRPFESVEDAFQQLLPYALYADPADTADSPGALETPVSTTDSSSSSCRLSPPTDPVFSSTFLSASFVADTYMINMTDKAHICTVQICK